MILHDTLSAKNALAGVSLPYTFNDINVNTKKEYVMYSYQDAEDLFDHAGKRLLDVNNWNELCEESCDRYCLTDKYGNPKKGNAAEGDYIRIVQDKPDLVNGEVYTWLHIEKVLRLRHDEWQSLAMRTRQARNPMAAESDRALMHNNNPATTFIVERSGHRISATTRNPKQQTAQQHSYQKVRDIFSSILKSVGLKKNNWDTLLEALLKD